MQAMAASRAKARASTKAPTRSSLSGNTQELAVTAVSTPLVESKFQTRTRLNTIDLYGVSGLVRRDQSLKL